MHNPIGKISIFLGVSLLFAHPLKAMGRPFFSTLCVAELHSKDPKSKINFRSGAGLEQPVVGIGQSGDLVHLVSQSSPEPDIKKDRFGKLWYRVKLPRQNYTGYVREDFLKRYCLVNNQEQ